MGLGLGSQGWDQGWGHRVRIESIHFLWGLFIGLNFVRLECLQMLASEKKRHASQRHQNHLPFKILWMGDYVPHRLPRIFIFGDLDIN